MRFGCNGVVAMLTERKKRILVIDLFYSLINKKKNPNRDNKKKASKFGRQQMHEMSLK